MRRGVRTRELLLITLLTLTVVATTTAVQLTHLAELGVEEAHQRAQTEIREIVALAQVALARNPRRPPADALAGDAALQALLDSVVAHAPDVVYARVEDREGNPLAAGTPTQDRSLPEPASLDDLLAADPFRRLWRLFRSGELVETRVPLELEEHAFGTVRLGADTSLLRAHLNDALVGSSGVALLALGLSWVVAVGVTILARRPLHRLSRQIERLRAGDYDFEENAWDLDFGQLSSQLRVLGREIQSQRLALLAEKRTLEGILDHLQDGILLTDEDDAILFYNRALSALLGHELREVAGLPLEDVLAPSHPLVRAVRHSRAEHADMEHVRVSMDSDDRFRESMLSVFPIAERDEQEAKGILVVLEDLTGLRTLQDLVQYSARVAETGQLTAGVAHEVRNPLNSLHLNLQLLRQHLGPDDGEMLRTLDVLDDAVRSLNRVVEGLVDYLRPAPMEWTEVDLNALLRGLATFFEAEARERGVRLDLQLDADKTRIEGDEDRLRQVFVNLIRNAFDAMPGGGTLRFRTASEGRMLRIDVEDTGEGILPEHRPRIFQLYYTTRPDGSGIGLSMVHRIVLEHGGSIDVHAEPGRGARFEIRLPPRGRRGPARSDAEGSA